jgi:competence protein ComGC
VRPAVVGAKGTIFRGVPPNFQRFLPLLLVAVLVLVVVPSLLKKKSSSGQSASARATLTINAMKLIDTGEQAYKAGHGAYTSHLADLIAVGHRLASDLASGLAVQLDAGSNGQSFYARVESDNLSLIRARSGNKLIANSCLILKSASGVKCPPATG